MSAQESVEEKYQAICFVSSTAPDAETARQKLIGRYGDVPREQRVACILPLLPFSAAS